MTKRQSHALETVAQTARWVADTTRDRDKAIRVAVRLGLSYRTVAQAAGIGHTTVQRIVNGAKP